MTIPLYLNPADLKLPEKFTDFRDHQLAALDKIFHTEKKVIMCQAPPGSGRTLLMAAMGSTVEDTHGLYLSYQATARAGDPRVSLRRRIEGPEQLHLPQEFSPDL